jgi:asparagine synthase (glutamine-hydrolysing)
MANSLELRAPFLDKDFASFCIALPTNYKITKDQEKYLFREACGNLWTDDIRKREKQGFAASVHLWFKDAKVIELKKHYLENRNNKIYSILNPSKIEAFSKLDNTQTWALLNLSMWMEMNLFKIS